MKPAGLYYWAGPGTVRMIGLKYFDPKIDEQSFLAAYDFNALSAFKRNLGVTDAWVTYSWGFGDATEKEDRAFLRSKLNNFARADIRTHAYVQGTNLVFAEHRDHDYYCRDNRGSLLPYHRGRKLCCPNNPHFRALIKRRVGDASKEDVSGVFVDNVHFGQFPLRVGRSLTFFGCACDHCKSLFKQEEGAALPLRHEIGSPATDAYLRFRMRSLHGLLAELAVVAHGSGKQFGSNSYDLTLDSKLAYGFESEEVRDMQDYLLLENFRHPVTGRGNGAAAALIKRSAKPIFIVSYRTVIGRHGALRQKDIDAVHTESEKLGYSPCYKASEFTTRGIWHALSPFALRIPKIVPLRLLPEALRSSSAGYKRVVASRLCTRLVNRVDQPLYERICESRTARRFFGWLPDFVTMRKSRLGALLDQCRRRFPRPDVPASM